VNPRTTVLPGERSTGPRPGRWFASEWGLAILALVLALLVWAVVWREISAQDQPFEVRLDLETSPRFTAFYDGRVELSLQGPRGEIEDARRALASPPVLNVRLPDLAPGEDHREIQITREMITFPFPARLVGSVGLEGTSTLPAADVYRVREQQITFLDPPIEGVPSGIGYTISIEPRTHPVRGPAGKLGTGSGEIRPDPVDLAPYFPDGSRELPGETRIRCKFNEWREDPKDGRFRARVDLPEVEVVLSFNLVATREITNRLMFDIPPEYEARADPSERYAEGRYRGLFRGRHRDLDRLERAMDSWWFVVRVPPEKLPAENLNAEGGQENVPEGFPIEFFHAGSLDGLHVELVEREILVVTIQRKP
jgi:hypothetical protein